jgi:hypothetical protein
MISSGGNADSNMVAQAATASVCAESATSPRAVSISLQNCWISIAAKDATQPSEQTRAWNRRAFTRSRSSLTAVSQTGESIPDVSVLTGRPEGPDLRNRTQPDSPDTRHETTDQKVGGLSPSERATYQQVRAISLTGLSDAVDLCERLPALLRVDIAAFGKTDFDAADNGGQPLGVRQTVAVATDQMVSALSRRPLLN